MGRADELRALLAALGVRPNRRLGQNFLVDGNLLAALLRTAQPQPGQDVLEVGPGTGILTERLLAAGCRVTAVEIDHRLAAYLGRRFGTEPRFRLVEGDACRTDYAALFGETPFRCISNLPYACSSPFLALLAGLASPPLDVHVLLQREVAERLAAAPGSPAYGVLTVRLQLRYAVRILRTVPAEVFWPAPQVGSAFVQLVRRPDPCPEPLRRQTSELAGILFAQRRKKVARVLTDHLRDRNRAEAALAAAGLPPEARAEGFSPADFARLAACLNPQ